MSERTITVCDHCLRACCWQGQFMCDDSFHAGTTEKTVDELRALGREHSYYWTPDKELVEAGHECVTAEDGLAAMLRFGAANDAAVAALDAATEGVQHGSAA